MKMWTQNTPNAKNVEKSYQNRNSRLRRSSCTPKSIRSGQNYMRKPKSRKTTTNSSQQNIKNGCKISRRFVDLYLANCYLTIQLQRTSNDRHDQVVVNYVVANNLSFRHLNSETSRRFAHEKIILKSDSYYRELAVGKMYYGVKHEVEKILNNMTHVSCTTDIYTNRKGSLMR